MSLEQLELNPRIIIAVKNGKKAMSVAYIWVYLFNVQCMCSSTMHNLCMHLYMHLYMICMCICI